MSTSVPQENSASAPVPTRSWGRRLTRCWGLIVVLLSSLVLAITWLAMPPDRTIQMFITYGTLAPTVLLFGIWWLFGSGLRWRVRLGGAGAAALIVGVFCLLVRIEGVTGEVIPILAWRWSPNRQQQAREYFSTASPTPHKEATTDQKKLPPLKITVADWPGYRGAERDSVVRDWTFRETWEPSPPPLLWKHPVGAAWSSWAVADGWAFTQEQRDAEEVIAAYSALTGETRWIHREQTRFDHPIGGPGPRATPTLHDNRLYCLGATGWFHCLDPQTGQVHWSHQVLQEHLIEVPEYGLAGSPLIVDDLVIIHAGGEQNFSLIAYDRISGELRWHSGSGKASYTSLQLLTIHGQSQIVIYDARGAASYAPDDGRELWRFDWSNNPQINAAQPVLFGENQIFLSTGYGVGSVAFSVNKQQNTWQTAELWRSTQFKAKFNSVVQRDSQIFGLDEGILTCFDLSTGKRRWKGGRYGYGQLLEVDGVLLLLAESGEACFVNADPKKFKELHRFQALAGKTWNHPVLWHGYLLVRNGEEAACYDLREWLKQKDEPQISKSE